MSSMNVGRYAEGMAEAFLKKKGYEILAKNFKVAGGEIDLVASDKGTIVFTEVKYRNNDGFGNPFDFITKTKIKRIVYTASVYLSKYKLDAPVRFDAIGITAESGEIEHIENAFESHYSIE